MELIFSNLVNKDDWTVVTVLDDMGVVIASSDPFHIPIGVTLTPVLDSEYGSSNSARWNTSPPAVPRSPTRAMAGPSGIGHVMVPIQHAFDQNDAQTRRRHRGRRA